MLVRRCGLVVVGSLLCAACSSGRDAQQSPAETTPEVTAARTTQDLPAPTAPSTNATAEIEQAPTTTPATTIPETTAPESTTIEAPEPNGPLEVFQEAVAAFNEVQSNPEDVSIRPAAYQLMTERFRADRSFEVATGDPQFLDPWKDLVVFGPAVVDGSGDVATFWYCQRQVDPDPDSGLDVSAVWRARMEVVDGQWRWADRNFLGSSDEDAGCPEGGEAFAPVANDVLEQVEGAAIGYFDAQRLAVADPRNSDLVDDLESRSDGTVRARDDRLLAQTIELDLQVLDDPSASATARLLGAHQLVDGDVTTFMCVPDNSKAIRPGEDPADWQFLTRLIVWGMTFTESNGAWIAVDGEFIVDWRFSGSCEPF